MPGKRGQAALLDAMIFLTVAAIVSVSLVAVTSNRYQDQEVDLRDYVDRAHEVVLRTTVQMTSSGEYENTWITVSDFAIAYFLALNRGEDLNSYEREIKEIAEMIEGLIPSWTNFAWRVILGSDELLIGDVPINAECVWPSSLYSEMPILGGELQFKLEIWR
ncbi:MAG: hypothetical protein GKC03_08080 [Methanomassiliicoccales archaeon]|nr:hypothetical protein [Methanomassiliicoccales archaeon]NYT15823.1 hypothetical protein [Methanomassiliicoccales archaeon]